MCYTKCRRFDWPAFLRALETGQTNRLSRTYAVTHSTSIPETTLHYAVVRSCRCRPAPFRSLFQNARSVLRYLHFNACDPRRSVELDFTRLSEIESRSVWLDTIPLDAKAFVSAN